MDLNRVFLIGRISSEIEVKKIPESGNSVLNFIVATNRKYTNKDWNIVEEPEFHRCVAFGKLADILWQYMSKWRRLFVEWRLRTRKWEDSQGNIRYTTEIIIENFIFLDSRPSQASLPQEENITVENPPIEPTQTTIPEEELPF